ncbi:hypothetical protein HELRODRAFT_189514 [Helobdella robusta]|uniref:Vesicle-fusing ATPase n=1 Tax=Helobdella robusta TaxID=6412 RepID=T1FR43_HELRO|nr:hypothetical protein HELRODRAFT_189514 [Helobdella robusta]ESN92582.1 hypothetical protein HELRODRAFT_189514 [Helobdella robusta]
MPPNRLKAAKCPTDELSLTNCAVVSDKDFDVTKIRHLEVITGPNHHYVFTLKSHPSVSPETIGFSAPQRKWAVLSLGQIVDVRPYFFDPNKDFISSMVLEVDFIAKKNTTTEPYDTDKMAAEFVMQFPQQAFTVGQELVFSFMDKKLLIARVKEMEALDVRSGGKTSKVRIGVTMPNTILCFDKADNSPVNLIGKCKGKQTYQSIISPDWNFDKMGIGGLDKEFSTIFRRAFASRVFPPEVIEQIGLKHCRGVLLHGPPGTGKTLMARQIGKMLNAREPKIINGPQILDKYVGESEANIRKLFAEAEEEEKRMGINSGLHIIIFDEIDAICKARGSVAGSTAVHDTVVNQLLSKIDGVDQLNNILVIGMTNRKDMIDDALLRPGRLEVQMEIGLPDENGRLQILNIHTKKLKDNNKLSADVSLQELASVTKNFSGAELEGLVRAATSTAMNGLIKVTSDVEIDPEATDKLKITMADFRNALANDIKPAFGVSEDEIGTYMNRGIINWGDPVNRVLQDGDLLVNQVRTSELTQILTVLLEGPPGCGKTALAAQIALKSDFPFLKIISPENMIGHLESARVQAIKKVFDDAYKSPLSCIILDDIEGLLDYVAIGPRFSNLVFQALRVLLRKLPPPGRRLLVICTTGCKDLLQEMQLLSVFRKVLHVSNLSTSNHLVTCLEELNLFTAKELDVISRMTDSKKVWIGIKTLLDFAEMIRKVEDEYRITKFISILEDEGSLQM